MIMYLHLQILLFSAMDVETNAPVEGDDIAEDSPASLGILTHVTLALSSPITGERVVITHESDSDDDIAMQGQRMFIEISENDYDDVDFDRPPQTVAEHVIRARWEARAFDEGNSPHATKLVVMQLQKNQQLLHLHHHDDSAPLTSEQIEEYRQFFENASYQAAEAREKFDPDAAEEVPDLPKWIFENRHPRESDVEELVGAHKPKYSILFRFSEQALELLLTRLCSMMKSGGYSERMASWIFAVLACVLHPSPELTFDLREFAKFCKGAASATENSQSRKSLFGFAVIIALTRPFLQKDILVQI